MIVCPALRITVETDNYQQSLMTLRSKRHVTARPIAAFNAYQKADLIIGSAFFSVFAPIKVCSN